MRILIDEAVWGVPKLFEPLGSVRTYRGRALTASDIADADALIVRSVTPVTADVLRGTPVRFVGTVSTGDDHIDTAFLSVANIAFASAAGFNARTVAEYVIAAILELARRDLFELPPKTLGVFGVGRIGSIVARWGELLGMKVLRCDPPRARVEGGSGLVLPDVLRRESDIITLHVPLTHEGVDATYQLINASWLADLRPRTTIINTSRGDVVDESALLDAIRTKHLQAVLDVWHAEPRVNRELAKACAIATPHIAGYSLDATRRGAIMIRNALARFIGDLEPIDARIDALDDPNEPYQRMTLSHESLDASIRDAVAASLNIAEIDAAMRTWLSGPADAAGFDGLRRSALSRREFSAIAPILPADSMKKAAPILRELGFRFP
ncbi:MAG: 4-phosphoerythronate dehydrogenase [Planctomycetes bacterium]|nr:4-phosphoerythronate dehydrogenase [Planctomycetota bacterium]